MKEIPYRELIDTLLWVSNGTRPDISYVVSTLAKYTTNPGMLHWKALLRVLGYLYATQEYCIKYARNGSVVDGSVNARLKEASFIQSQPFKSCASSIKIAPYAGISFS